MVYMVDIDDCCSLDTEEDGVHPVHSNGKLIEGSKSNIDNFRLVQDTTRYHSLFQCDSR